MNVVPLEIWDAPIDGRSLFERRAEPDFFTSLAAIANALRGESKFHEVALVGGGVDPARATAAFTAHELPLAVVSDDPFFAAEGARDFADVVLDVGQTSLKVVGPRGRARLPRAEDRDREAFARCLAAAIESVASPRPSTVLIALPCSVDGSRLGESSYPTEGDAARLLAALRLDAEVTLMNDAVLAARVVAARVTSVASRLVLTIGHGVGAARIDP